MCDPIAKKASVQMQLVSAICLALKDEYDLDLIAPYIPENKLSSLKKLGITNVSSISETNPITHYFYNLFTKNESMLWSVSWLMEAIFRNNSSNLNVVSKKYNDIVINLGHTVPVNSDLYWNQATPPSITIKQMGKYNIFFRYIFIFFGGLIEFLDRRIRIKHWLHSKHILSPSKYISELYEKDGFPSEDILYDPKIFIKDEKTREQGKNDYVLAYIGKEVELDTVLEISKSGIRVLAFGSKIPVGTSISEIKEELDYRGYVTDEELATLYHNAMFTIFPFTEEPFGWVPVESMHYGTPVLTYNRQGPSETVINNVTGWLEESREDLIRKAREIWSRKNTGIDRRSCRERAEEFSIERFSVKLKSVLNSLD